MVGDVKAGISAHGRAGAVFEAPGGEGALKPNSFRGGAMFDQRYRCCQRGHQTPASLRIREAVDGGDELGTMELEGVLQQLPFRSGERAARSQCSGHLSFFSR